MSDNAKTPSRSFDDIPPDGRHGGINIYPNASEVTLARHAGDATTVFVMSTSQARAVAAALAPLPAPAPPVAPADLDEQILAAAKRLVDAGFVPTKDRIRAEVKRGTTLVVRRIEFLEGQNRWPYRTRQRRRSAFALAGRRPSSAPPPEPKPEPSDNELSLDALIGKVRSIRAADAERFSQTMRAR